MRVFHMVVWFGSGSSARCVRYFQCFFAPIGTPFAFLLSRINGPILSGFLLQSGCLDNFFQYATALLWHREPPSPSKMYEQMVVLQKFPSHT